MISVLSAINGMILTAPRVYATLGADHRGMRWLATWNRKHSAPTAAMIAQAAIAVVMVLGVGTPIGQSAIDRTISLIGMPAISWAGGFETLVVAAAPVFWFFFLATGTAYFVLRQKDPQRDRPFRAPLFPLPVLVFCAMCGFMLYSSAAYAGGLTLLGAAPVAAGGALYAALGRRR
jgi:amino acid transporter